MTQGPRLLLVEDDPTIQHLVRLALEDLALELKVCGSLAEAWQVLEQAPVQMLITDLMLPDGSGLDLVRTLVESPRLRGEAPLVVFSAGLSAEKRQQLAALGVWRMLNKPCSVLELEACVVEGLALTRVSRTSHGPAPAARPAPAALTPAQAAAVAAHFGGDQALYQAFRDACLGQFQADRQQGDLACSQRDAPALRRLAHSLKSVLLTLGHEPESRLARQLEASAEPADWAQSLPLWAQLRSRLPDQV